MATVTILRQRNPLVEPGEVLGRCLRRVLSEAPDIQLLVARRELEEVIRRVRGVPLSPALLEARRIIAGVVPIHRP